MMLVYFQQPGLNLGTRMLWRVEPPMSAGRRYSLGACLPACLHPIQFVLSFDLGVLRISLFSQNLRGLMFSLVPFQRDAPSHEVSSVDLLPLSSSDCWMAPSEVRSLPPTHCRCAAMHPPLRLHLPSRSQSNLQPSTSNLQQSTDRPTTFTVDTTQRD